MKIIRISFIISFLLCSIYALSETAGTSGMTFLKIDFSPLSSALGGATASFANGPDGILSNPASMSFENKTSAGTSFAVLYSGITGGNVVAQRGFDFGKLGFSFRFLTYGTMDRMSQEGDLLGEFGSTDLAFSVAYSREIAENISLGAAPFFATSSIDTFSAMAFGLDLGAIYKFNRGKGRIGLTAKNIGTQTSAFVDTTDPLPTNVSLGVNYRLAGLPLIACVQGDWFNDMGFSGGAGFEIIQLKPLFLRVGYRYRPRLSGELAEDDMLNGFSGGFGVKYNGIYADYSFQHFGTLGFTHKFAVAYDGFGR